MKIKIAILFAGLFLTINVSYSNFSVPVIDTSLQSISLKEKAFLKQYGTDDTARALIHYWFKKRHLFASLASGSGVLALFSAGSISKGGGGNSTAIDKPYFIDPAAFFAVMGLLVGCILIIPFLTHSRKKLLRLLEKYKAGNPIPKKYRKRLIIDK